MRKRIFGGLALAMCALSVTAVAADRDVAGPQAQAYVNFSFGGAGNSLSRSFQYGLSLDVQSARNPDLRPPLVDLRFNGQGQPLTRIGGLSVVRQVRLNQDEEGSDSGEVPTGDETTYSVIDWTLVAVGALGIGFVAYEALDNEESGAAAPPAEEEGGGGLLPIPELCDPSPLELGCL